MKVAKKEGIAIPAVFEVLREPDAAGLSVEGKLQAGDPIDSRYNTFCKVYQVRLVAKRTYTIDMRRKLPDIDPYLRLVDANGFLRLEDDDGGGNRDARIIFTPDATGDYRIVATTLPTMAPAGSFTLSIDRAALDDQKGFEKK